MRVRHLLYGGLLAVALFASQSFAAALAVGATFESSIVANVTSASTQEVPQFAADWAVSAGSQQLNAFGEGHNSRVVSLPQTVKVINDQPARAGEVVQVNYIVDTRAGPVIATAYSQAAGKLSNYSSPLASLAPTGTTASALDMHQANPRFVGLVRTEHITLSSAAAQSAATAKEAIGV